MDDTDVFFRLLSELDASLLAQHCNGVLDRKLQRVGIHVEALLVAHARLSEVREAVARAEHGRTASVGRTTRLLATAEATAQVCRDLSARMERLIASPPQRAELNRLMPVPSRRPKRERPRADSADEEGDDTGPQTTNAKVARRSLPQEESTVTQAMTMETEETESEREEETDDIRGPTDSISAITTALGTAQQLEANAQQSGAPTKVELGSVVKMVVELLAKVALRQGESVTTLGDGQFVLLLGTVERLFHGLKYRRFCVRLVRSVIHAVNKALTRDQTLAELVPYRDRLVAIWTEMELPSEDTSAEEAVPPSEITTSDPVVELSTAAGLVEELSESDDEEQTTMATRVESDPEEADHEPQETKHDIKPLRQQVAAVQTMAERLLKPPMRPLLEHEVNAFVQALVLVLTNIKRPACAKKPRHRAAKKFRLLMSMTVRVLGTWKDQQKDSVLPLALRVISAINDAFARDPSLVQLSRCRTRLADIVASKECATPFPSTVRTRDEPSTPFETLTKRARNLLTSPLDNRSDQVVSIVKELDETLSATFPTTRTDPTSLLVPAESTLNNATAAVETAAALILEVPLTQPNKAQFQQFSNRLDQIVGAYATMKLRMHQTRKDLRWYLQATPKPAATAVETTPSAQPTRENTAHEKASTPVQTAPPRATISTRPTESPTPRTELFNQYVSTVLRKAQLLENDSNTTPPTKSQLAELVKTVVQIVTTIKGKPESRVRSLAHGDFAHVLGVTERLFNGVKHRRSSAPLLRTTIAAMNSAIARDEALAELTVYRDKLLQIQTEMESAKESSTTTTGSPLRYEILSKLAGDIRSLRVAERPARLSQLLTKLTQELHATFPTNKPLASPDEDTVDAASHAVKAAVELVTIGSLSVKTNARDRKLLDLLCVINAKYSAMKARLDSCCDGLHDYLFGSTPSPARGYVTKTKKKQQQKRAQQININMDVFARILARLDAPRLQRHCSAVVDEELCLVREELQEVLAAFARLEEVRVAVASLETGRADVRRSATVMETVATTAELQEALHQRMRTLGSMVRARPAVKLDASERCASDDHETEKTQKTVVVSKRKRRDDQAEEEREAKTIKKVVTQASEIIKEEVQELYASETHEAERSLVEDAWGSGASSATESESESDYEDEPPRVSSQASATPAQEPMALEQWEHHVYETGKIAQRLFAARVAPAIDELTNLTQWVRLVLANVPSVQVEGAFRGIAKGQFNNLVSLTVRVFQSGQRNKAFLPLAETVLRALREAMDKQAALSGLQKYYEELYKIQQKMAQYDITASNTLPPPRDTLPPPVAGRWEDELKSAVKAAQVIMATKGRRSAGQLMCVVEWLERIVPAVKVPHGVTSLEQLAGGQFEQFLSLTIRVATKDKSNPKLDPALDRAIAVLENASLTHPTLRGLRTFAETLRNVKRRAEDRPDLTIPPASSGTFNAVKWEAGAHKLHAHVVKLTQKSHVPLDTLAWVVDSVCEMVDKATEAPEDSTKLVTCRTFYGVLMCTTQIFNGCDVDASYLPLLHKTRTALERVSQRQRRFQNLRLYAHDLSDAATRLASRKPVVPTPVTPIVREKPASASSPSSAAGPLIARFEALVATGDELLAMPVSERSGRVDHLVFSLQSELKAAFPSSMGKGHGKQKRASPPSRGALSAAADAVRKAVDLIVLDTRATQQQKSAAFHKQFLELLFALSAKYHTIKPLIARSRDDLYQFVYPHAKLPQPRPMAVTDTSVARSATDETVLREKLVVVYRRVQTWHDDIFSLKEFDDALRVVRAVMDLGTRATSTWRVRRDRSVAACLQLLAERARAIKKTEHRDARLASVAQWQQQMEV